jgi:heme/copper-type cytochrome/quinol oxidase subunit 2
MIDWEYGGYVLGCWLIMTLAASWVIFFSTSLIIKLILLGIEIAFLTFLTSSFERKHPTLREKNRRPTLPYVKLITFVIVLVILFMAGDYVFNKLSPLLNLVFVFSLCSFPQVISGLFSTAK